MGMLPALRMLWMLRFRHVQWSHHHELHANDPTSSSVPCLYDAHLSLLYDFFPAMSLGVVDAFQSTKPWLSSSQGGR